MHEQIIDLYQQLLLRTPNSVEIDSWINTGFSIDQIRHGIVISPERRKKIGDLYDDLLFRPATDADINCWLNHSLEQVRQGILISPERASKIAKLCGFEIAVDPNDHTMQRIKSSEGFDHWELILQPLKPGDVAIDLGAHQGTFSVQAAARGAVVVAVEASETNVRYLRATVKMNPELDIRVFHRCCWSHKTELEFFDDRAWGHVVTSQTTDGIPPNSKVLAEPVDDLVGPLLSERVVCAKIDVEGSELKALQGMQKLIAQGIDILYESNSHCLHHNGIDLREPCRLLQAAGYKNYLVHETELYPLTGNWTQPTTVHDILATKKDPKSFGRRVHKPMSNQKMASEMLRLLNLPESRNHVQREINNNPKLAIRALLQAL